MKNAAKNEEILSKQKDAAIIKQKIETVQIK
jgi:hypothetical protein